MAETSAPPLRVVFAGEDTSAEERLELVEALLQKGFTVTCTADRSAAADVDGPGVLVLENGGAEALERPPLGTGAGGAERHAWSVPDFGDVEAVLGLVEHVAEETGAYRNPGWKPWFPVIDYKRCTNCMQCLSFCLFDVYGVDENQAIQVQNNAKCKTNCPACSRVCPEVAILFPKYGAGPINGDEVQAADVQREKMKVDISALLGGDIYSLLRERHERAASRFSKERDETKALKERQRCLKQVLVDQVADIPQEVLMALPSPEEIQKRALEAREKAQAARERRQARGDAGAAGPPEA